MLYELDLIILLLQMFLITGANSEPKRNCDAKSEDSLNSFLWTLKRDPPAYFFGTIHVPYTRVWDFIPNNTKKAFHQAENIFFELDLTDPYTISALSSCQLLPPGENLANILPDDIYDRLKRHLEYVRLMLPGWMTPDQRGRGLYADYLFNAIAGNWERKRPVWVMLMVNSLTESDIRSRGIPVLDLYLAQEAERHNKITGAVERVEEQCVPLNDLNLSQVLFALNHTLWQHEVFRLSKGAMPYTTDDLIEHYNCGDLNAIIFNRDTTQIPNLVNSSLKPHELQTARLIDEYFRNELIDKRNQRMTDRVIRLLKAHPSRSFFFAFGAGHFLGNYTVLDRMQEAGFDIAHTASYEPILTIHKTRHRKVHKGRKHWNGMAADYPMFEIKDEVEYLFRQRLRLHRRRKQRRRKLAAEAERANFNELWVRLETQSRPNLLKLAHSRGKGKTTTTTTAKPFVLLPLSGADSVNIHSCVRHIWVLLWLIITR